MSQERSEKNQINTVAFYRAYHSNIWNVLVHLVWVPVIELCSFGLAHHFTQGLFSKFGIPHFNVVSLYILLTAPRYLAFDFFSGVLRLAVLFGNYYAVTHLFDLANPAVITKLAIFKGVGWLLQFAAHRFLEGRAPALLDSAKDALTMAPYFVLLELMFFFGYKPHLQKEIDNEAAKMRADYEKQKTQKKKEL